MYAASVLGSPLAMRTCPHCFVTTCAGCVVNPSLISEDFPSPTAAAVTAQRDPDVTVVEVTAELRPLLPLIGGLRLHATGRSVTERFRPVRIGGAS